MQELNPHMTFMNQQNQAPAAQAANANPLFEDWSEPFGVPPFGRIGTEHFLPALPRPSAAHEAEVAAIPADAAEPTFANTIDALETAGDALTRASSVFYLLAGAHTNDAIQEVERELAPLAAKHWNRILMDEGLFRRIDALHRRREQLGLTAEQARVLDRYHAKYKRAGAALDAPAQARLRGVQQQRPTPGPHLPQERRAGA